MPVSVGCDSGPLMDGWMAFIDIENLPLRFSIAKPSINPLPSWFVGYGLWSTLISIRTLFLRKITVKFLAQFSLPFLIYKLAQFKNIIILGKMTYRTVIGSTEQLSNSSLNLTYRFLFARNALWKTRWHTEKARTEYRNWKCFAVIFPTVTWLPELSTWLR